MKKKSKRREWILHVGPRRSNNSEPSHTLSNCFGASCPVSGPVPIPGWEVVVVREVLPRPRPARKKANP